MIKLESTKMQKAIAKAKTARPFVKMAGERVYSVSGSRGNAYTVRFAVANGMKLAECNCPAGQSGMRCYHVAAAAAVNIAVMTMRKAAAQKAAPAPAVETVANDDRAQLISDINAAPHRAHPFESISLKLHRLFGVTRLEDVSTEGLRQVLAALEPRKADEKPAPTNPRRPVIVYYQSLAACAKGRGSLTRFYGLAVRAGMTTEQAEAELNARRDAFDDLHDLLGTVQGHRLYQEVDLILSCSYLQELELIPLTDR